MLKGEKKQKEQKETMSNNGLCWNYEEFLNSTNYNNEYSCDDYYDDGYSDYYDDDSYNEQGGYGGYNYDELMVEKNDNNSSSNGGSNCSSNGSSNYYGDKNFGFDQDDDLFCQKEISETTKKETFDDFTSMMSIGKEFEGYDFGEEPIKKECPFYENEDFNRGFEDGCSNNGFGMTQGQLKKENFCRLQNAPRLKDRRKRIYNW